jgi:hypothetical protein
MLELVLVLDGYADASGGENCRARGGDHDGRDRASHRRILLRQQKRLRRPSFVFVRHSIALCGLASFSCAA